MRVPVSAFFLVALTLVVVRPAILAEERPPTTEGGGEKRKGLDATELADFAREARQKHGLAALLCGVWHGDDEVMTIALGNSMTNEPATKDMHLRVGGVTLTCACVVLLRLVDEGRVSL